MDLFTFTLIGIAVAFLHVFLPGQHRVGFASAIALGVFGALNGALIVSAFTRGGWAIHPPVALVGALVGAMVCIGAIELAADVHAAREERSL
jgi:uncharacterized membrane protein YeaQ/YmgE (transglycosylase-associated protein family)